MQLKWQCVCSSKSKGCHMGWFGDKSIVYVYGATAVMSNVAWLLAKLHLSSKQEEDCPVLPWHVRLLYKSSPSKVCNKCGPRSKMPIVRTTDSMVYSLQVNYQWIARIWEQPHTAPCLLWRGVWQYCLKVPFLQGYPRILASSYVALVLNSYCNTSTENVLSFCWVLYMVFTLPFSHYLLQHSCGTKRNICWSKSPQCYMTTNEGQFLIF
jgi:hypothetical protein